MDLRFVSEPAYIQEHSTFLHHSNYPYSTMKIIILALIFTTVATANPLGHVPDMRINLARPLARRDLLQKRGSCLGKCASSPPPSPRRHDQRPPASSFDMNSAAAVGRFVQMTRPPRLGSTRPLPVSDTESDRSGR